MELKEAMIRCMEGGNWMDSSCSSKQDSGNCGQMGRVSTFRYKSKGRSPHCCLTFCVNSLRMRGRLIKRSYPLIVFSISFNKLSIELADITPVLIISSIFSIENLVRMRDTMFRSISRFVVREHSRRRDRSTS